MRMGRNGTKMKSVKEKKLLICYEICKEETSVSNEIIKALWQQWYPL